MRAVLLLSISVLLTSCIEPVELPQAFSDAGASPDSSSGEDQSDGFISGDDGGRDRPTVLFEEGFEDLVDGEDPPGWQDTLQNTGNVEPNAFKVRSRDKNMVFVTELSAWNMHSHYIDPIAASWTNYQFSGRLMLGPTSEGIGVTIFSKYPGEDSYYRLRSFSGQKSFHLARHPEELSADSPECDSGVEPVSGKWYQFRFRATVGQKDVRLQAKVWPATDSRPDSWQIDCSDNSVNQLKSGTIGLWSLGIDDRWDDLRVMGR